MSGVYYSLKGWLYFDDPQKIADRINRFPKLRSQATVDGVDKVQFEATLETLAQRDNLATELQGLVETNGGYVVFSECVQNPDGTIGSCKMTHNYYNPVKGNSSSENPGNILT